MSKLKSINEHNMTALTLIVCGGRDYDDDRWMFEVLDRINKKQGISMIVHGGAAGADATADAWARRRDIPVDMFVADWKTYGKAAGPIRNQQMLDEAKPDGVIAFPGGRGTADMVRRAKEAGVKVKDLRDVAISE